MKNLKLLHTNLQTKVDKFGDTISGNLNILVEHDESKRTFGVPNISTGKTVILYLGDAKNMIYHKFDDPMLMTATHGLKFSTPDGNVCHLGGDNTKSLFYNDIVMNDKSITDLHNPSAKQDAATKHYVDTRSIKSNVGYVPNLTSNTNKNGFIVSASSEYFESEAYHVFNDNENGDWTTADSVNTNFWIQIKCPEKVKVYKIKLCGSKMRNSNGIINDKILFNWKWQGSNDGSNWTTLNEYNDTMIGNEIVEVIVSASAYYYYRIFVNKAETTKLIQV